MAAVKGSYKRQYCGNRDYVPSGSYPRLLCGDNFLKFSYIRQGKVLQPYFARGNKVYCNQVIKVLNDPLRYGSFKGKPAILYFAFNNCQEEIDKTFDEDDYNNLINDHESSEERYNKMSRKEKWRKIQEKYKKKCEKRKYAYKIKIKDEL